MATKNTDTPKIKLIAELNKIKAQAPLEVEAEINKTIKVISQKEYKLPDEENPAEMAERIRKEVEKKVANRKRYAPYGNMEAEELVRAWCCSSPELRIEFDSNFQWFVSRIIETFPDSPAQEFVSYTYLREFPNENLERMIRDRQQASTQKKEDEQPEGKEQDATPAKCRGIKDWLKRHPHSYGLIGGAIFLILFFILGLLKSQWRNWCWGTAVIAFLVLILSLLGGRSSR
jgi:hypothetical protein